MAASIVVDRLRLEIDVLRREAFYWSLRSIPEITIQSLVQNTTGLSVFVDILPSPELELPNDLVTIEFLISIKYGSYPPLVRCPGTFAHPLCDPKTRNMNLQMLMKAEKGWSKSYSMSAVLHTIRLSFMKKTDLELWNIRSKHLCLQEEKHQIKTTSVVVAHCASGSSFSVGAREVMEDALVCVNELACAATNGTLGFHPAVYCIADGHAGTVCAQFLVRNLPPTVSKHLEDDKSPREALWKAFTQVDSDFHAWAAANNDMSGSTCICLLYDGLDKVYCANVGDSRALLLRNGHAIQISRDHRSMDVEEQGYIANNGGFISNDRTFGQLTVTRAFGDIDIKKHFGKSLSAAPEISEWTLSSRGDYFLLASDGLFAVMDNRTVLGHISSMLQKKMTLSAIADELVRICVVDRGGEDNVSVILIQLIPEVSSNEDIHGDISLPPSSDPEKANILRSGKSVDRLLRDLEMDSPAAVQIPVSHPTKQNGLARRPVTTVSAAALQNDEELMDFLLDEQNFQS